jgi:hypothetical protein
MNSEEIKEFEKYCLRLNVVDHGFSQRQLQEMTPKEAKASIDVACRIEKHTSETLKKGGWFK